jgi:hypothetical protein
MLSHRGEAAGRGVKRELQLKDARMEPPSTSAAAHAANLRYGPRRNGFGLDQGGVVSSYLASHPSATPPNRKAAARPREKRARWAQPRRRPLSFAAHGQSSPLPPPVRLRPAAPTPSPGAAETSIYSAGARYAFSAGQHGQTPRRQAPGAAANASVDSPLPQRLPTTRPQLAPRRLRPGLPVFHPSPR